MLWHTVASGLLEMAPEQMRDRHFVLMVCSLVAAVPAMW